MVYKEWFYSDLVATEWDPITLNPIYNGTATKVMKNSFSFELSL